MTPINNTPLGPLAGDANRPEAFSNGKARRGNLGTEIVIKLKMLMATGAVAGTLGGWALLAQHDALSAAQSSAPQTTVASFVAHTATPSYPPQATPTPQQALQASATAVQSAATPTPQATATAVEPTDTPVPQPTATTAEPTVAPAVTPVARTRSSR